MNNIIRSSVQGARVALVAATMSLGGVSAVSAQASKDCGEKRGDTSIAACTEAIRQNPREAYFFYNRGNAYYEKGENDRALADYNEAIRLNPFALAFNNRGNVYTNKGDNERALADYNESIRLDPTFVNGYVGRGNYYRAKRDFDRAFANYNEAIRRNPKHANAFASRANLHELRGEKDRAIADYRIAAMLGHKYSLDALQRLGVSP